MTASRLPALAAIALGLLLAACTAESGRGITPKLADEGSCRATNDSHRCKLAHDLAGGYPFSLDSSR